MICLLCCKSVTREEGFIYSDSLLGNPLADKFHKSLLGSEVACGAVNARWILVDRGQPLVESMP